ncbi:MAG: M23 family metallopeptidase [Gammaproteobacteria bacterium]|nr:M23 family metallopeptidase [Gammaproteobacteria bacterium]MCP5135249.1 M23 family metallopeptidase [Gammaproteobacteria bacterium]
MRRSMFILRLSVILLTGAVLATGTARAELHFDGEVVQGGLLIGHADPGSRITVSGDAVTVSDSGVFLVGFGRSDTDPVEVVATAPDGRVERHTLTPRIREYDIQRIDGLPPGKVTPPNQEVIKRIRLEGAQISAARNRDDARTDFANGFIWPAKGRISGVYGSQRILNGKPRQPHYGVDVAAPVGTPVIAPAGGIVTFAHPDMYYSGVTVLIDHGQHLSSAFLHMSRATVTVGQRVEQGDKIGEIGATGRVTGPHLDWRMNWRDKRVDVALLVPPMEPPTNPPPSGEQ